MHPSDGDDAVTAETFRDVIGRLASGVTVITAVADDGRWLGTTASAVTSLSVHPPMVLACLNETSVTGAGVIKSGAFAINILGEDHSDLAMHFASKAEDKFADIALADLSDNGQPLLVDALATVECRVVDAVKGGTHTVLFGRVLSASARHGPPLAYFRGQFGRIELVQDQEAYRAIREGILAGNYQPGDVVPGEATPEIDRLHASSVQSALARLSADGLLEATIDGFRLRMVTWEEVNEGLQGRCIIELGVIDATVGKVEKDQLAQLSRAGEQWQRAEPGSSVSWTSRHEQSMDFHEEVVRLAGSDALVYAYRQLGVPSLLARAFSGYRITDQDEPFGEDHRALIGAYQDGDVNLARSIIISHTDRIRRQALSAGGYGG